MIRLALIFFLLGVGLGPAALRADWQSTNEMFVLKAVSNGQTNQFTYTNRLAWLTPEVLFYGTNRVTVQASQLLSSTNAIVSDPSAPVFVTREPSPGVRLIFGIHSSTNLVDWQPYTNFVLLIAADQPAAFFRPALEMQVEPEVITLIPTPK
ncbi:MAG: hypothetical protein H7Y43_04395 [Akkermansiaceae bacterium]|nr:hypothetical protein [Verrucomicrobiales bacterium]